MTIRPALLLLTLALAGGCCAPEACLPARRGFAALAPATEAILAAPPGAASIDPGSALAAGGLRDTGEGWAFPDGRGRMVSVVWDPARAELSFAYDGPGRNRCAWTPDASWACRGYY